jgi:hypothetical protein
MSGKKSDFSVTISYKKNDAHDYDNYKGCGNYLPDERLNAKWELESINSKPINKANFKSLLSGKNSILEKCVEIPVLNVCL